MAVETNYLRMRVLHYTGKYACSFWCRLLSLQMRAAVVDLQIFEIKYKSYIFK